MTFFCIHFLQHSCFSSNWCLDFFFLSMVYGFFFLFVSALDWQFWYCCSQIWTGQFSWVDYKRNYFCAMLLALVQFHNLWKREKISQLNCTLCMSARRGSQYKPNGSQWTAFSWQQKMFTHWKETSYSVL